MGHCWLVTDLRRVEIATTMHELEKAKLELEADLSKREANEMVRMCLWGNATVSGNSLARLLCTDLSSPKRTGSFSPHP